MYAEMNKVASTFKIYIYMRIFLLPFKQKVSLLFVLNSSLNCGHVKHATKKLQHKLVQKKPSYLTEIFSENILNVSLHFYTARIICSLTEFDFNHSTLLDIIPHIILQINTFIYFLDFYLTQPQ